MSQDHEALGRDELQRRLEGVQAPPGYSEASDVWTRQRRMEAASAAIRWRASIPTRPLRRWGWALEPVAGELPGIRSCRVAALYARATLAHVAGSTTADLALALAERMGDDWQGAARLLDGVHPGVSLRLLALAAMEGASASPSDASDADGERTGRPEEGRR